MSAEVMAKFDEMFGQLQEQPKDIEKLTEISEFIATVQTASEELQADIDKMTEHYEVLEELLGYSGPQLAQLKESRTI